MAFESHFFLKIFATSHEYILNTVTHCNSNFFSLIFYKNVRIKELRHRQNEKYVQIERSSYYTLKVFC